MTLDYSPTELSPMTPSPVDLSPMAVSERLRRVAELTDLCTTRRLDSKLDMRPAGVSARLRTVGQLHALCVRLGKRAIPIS
jgi:hypothetical protein